MKIETYDRNCIQEGFLIFLADGGDSWVPGAQVQHFVDTNAYGIIVSVVGTRITVLWSEEPIDFHKYASMAHPISRRINYADAIKNAFTIEPLPQGALPIYTKDRK